MAVNEDRMRLSHMDGILPLQSTGDPSSKDDQSADEHSLSPSIYGQLTSKQGCYPNRNLTEQAADHRPCSNVGQRDPTVGKFGRDNSNEPGSHA